MMMTMMMNRMVCHQIPKWWWDLFRDIIPPKREIPMKKFQTSFQAEQSQAGLNHIDNDLGDLDLNEEDEY